MAETTTNNSPSLTLGIHSELDFGDWRSPLLIAVETNPETQKQTIYVVLQQQRFEFNALYNDAQTFTGFTAAYHNKTGDSLNITELIGELIPSIADDLPTNLDLSLQDVVLAYQRLPNAATHSTTKPQQPHNAFLIGATLGLEINLADLPLIGDKLPTDLAPSLHGLQVLYVYQTIAPELAKTLQLPKSITLPQSSSGQSQGQPQEQSSSSGLSPGLYLSACLSMEGEPQWFTLPLTFPHKRNRTPQSNPCPNPGQPNSHQPNPSTSKLKQTTLTQSSTHTPTPQSQLGENAPHHADNSEEKILWLPLNKALGPIKIQKVGMRFHENELWVFLNASLSLGGLTLSCNGLGVGSSLTQFKPQFRLDGIGIHYSNPTLEIGGAFLRKTLTKQEGDKVITYDEYSGGVIIGTSTFTLSAIGSYAEINGEASLFIFALLDYPLGGVPAFFVTGLAVGFGYNRLLRPPETVEAVEDFPFVKLAMGDDDEKQDLLGVLDSIGPYIQPASGEMFFAIGIKFTSFKLIEAFVLVIVKLGKRAEFYILGLATLEAPSTESTESLGLEIEPIAKAKLTLKAVYIPDEGVLSIEGNLQEGSYLFSQKCHLSGGFAFYSWFSGEHEGDFVLSLGGYHPKFKVPSHYPQVPRFKLDWKLNNNLAIKGEGYFALTASALMAGGCLEACYRQSDVAAYFKIDANFLIAWKPFYYAAGVGLEIRASAKIGWVKLTVDIRARLQLWGPPFSGCAVLVIGSGWCSVSVDMKFGSSLPPRPKALTWSEFKASLLPSDNEVCSIAVDDGLLRKIERSDKEEWVFNPKEFAFSTYSAIPSNNLQIQEIEPISSKWNKKIFIRPMDLDKELDSTYKIEIKKGEKLVNNYFKYTPIQKNVPAALWGEGFMPKDVNTSQFVENALCGFKVTPATPPKAGKSQEIPYEKLLFDSVLGGGWQWGKSHYSQIQPGDKQKTQKIVDQISPAHKKRNKILVNLGFSLDDVSIDKSFMDELLDEPHILTSDSEGNR